MANNLINTDKQGKRVTSTYAEVYFDDDYCGFQNAIAELKRVTDEPSKEQNAIYVWKSPSDLLIGILELQPPFTSKITRGITHKGILAIGDNVLAAEQSKFHARVNKLVNDNNASWEFILDYEKKKIAGKVKEMFDQIFAEKSKIMIKEFSKYYESSLQDLEDHFRSEIKAVIVSTHANVIGELNQKIKSKLAEEKQILDKVLKDKFRIEIAKIKEYYKLLLNNEIYRNNKIYNQELQEKNDALLAFVRQAEAETITSTMYVMCAERKKCKINQFIIDNYQTLEISEKIKKIKEKQGILDDYMKKDVRIFHINKEWEDKTRRIMQLFLKFTSFSLKLLPEQTTFLLDLEKMVVLQLNELQKSSPKAPSILVEQNVFKFEEIEEPTDDPCVKEPFEIIGDTANSIPTSYGSRETIPSDVDLPFVRLDRQYIYAKCHRFEEVKSILESEKCICLPKTIAEKPPPLISVTQRNEKTQASDKPSEYTSESTSERILIDNYQRLSECPARQCKDWTKILSFPYLISYLDYTEEKLKTIKVIIGKSQKMDMAPLIYDPKDIVFKDEPYAEIKDLYNNAETQYSSQESLNYNADIECKCCSDSYFSSTDNIVSGGQATEKSQKLFNDIIAKRKKSLQKLMQEHPKLLKVFTDECFDFYL